MIADARRKVSELKEEISELGNVVEPSCKVQ